jgi:hypothetical protein
MPFAMSASKEELSGAPPLPAGWYKLQVKAFKPKASAVKPPATVPDSFNMNAEFEVIGNAQFDGRKCFAGLNSKAWFIIMNFVHACGLQMEELQDGNQGTEAANFAIPGVWEDSDKYPDDPSKWRYLGPLTNATFEAELAETEYQGKKRNEVRQFKCVIPGCTERHSTNLIK